MAVLPTSPWLPEMQATKCMVFGYRKFVELGQLVRWGEVLLAAEYKEQARAVEKLSAWVEDAADSARKLPAFAG